MDAFDLVFPAALAALALVAVSAARHPVLARVALRNTRRRPRQSILIVLGLLVGTAIVSGSFVASDSMEHAIVQATYDAFQEIDETVTVDGFHFFPERVRDALARDSRLDAAADAVGANIIWDGAAVNERTDQYEPRVRLVGFDPDADRPFGPFDTRDGATYGTELAPDDVVLHRTLADRLAARPGDRLTLNFSRPVDPLLPEIENHTGAVAAGAGGLPGVPSADPQPATVDVPIQGTVVRLTLVLTWDPGPGALQDLDLQLAGPDGAIHANEDGAPGAPDLPAVLNVTGSVGDPLAEGTWTVTVRGKAAAQTPFTLTVLRFHAVYDLDEFERRVEDLRTRFPDVDPLATLPGPEPQTRTVRVAAVAESGKGPNFRLPHDNNLFLRLDTLQTWLDRPGQVNLVKVTNPGGVEAGAGRTDDVLPVLRAALNDTKAANPDHAAIQALHADDDKRFWLAQARDVGETFLVFLTSVASFSVLAGLLLIINIFTMLAEERRAELGISRALGLRRGDLTRLFTIEGAAYALPAALLGTLAGLGLAAALIAGFNAFGDPGRFPPIPFRVETASLLLAFGTGVLLTLGTVHVGARRSARLNIVRAIRQLDEPELHRDRAALLGGILLLVAGGLATAAAPLTGSFAALILGPSLVAVGAGLLLRRRHRRRAVYPALALMLFAYLTVTLFTVEAYDSVEGNVFGPVRAVIMTFCIVVILVYLEAPVRLLARALAHVPPLRAISLPAFSYPLHRKFRTGLTLAMFGVVLMVVSLFSIFGSIFAPDPEKETGGYDLEAYTERSLDGLPASPALDAVARLDALPLVHLIGGDAVRVDNQTTAQFGPPQDSLYGIDDAFARNNRFRLLDRDPAYATDADAYAAVAADPSLAIVAYPYSTDEDGNADRHGPGDPLQVRARGGTRTFHIVGVQEQVHFKGVFLHQDALRQMFTDTDTLLLMTLRPGADPGRTADGLEAAHRDVGLDVRDIRAQVQQENETFRQIFALIQLFLSLGLIVGILSLGIVTARSVTERRQEIGMLRALGYRRRDVRRAFLLETLGLVAVGILVGLLVAVVVSYGLWVAIVQDLRIPYVIPWAQLALIAFVSFIATTLATLAPIRRAARTPPADALRYIE